MIGLHVEQYFRWPQSRLVVLLLYVVHVAGLFYHYHTQYQGTIYQIIFLKYLLLWFLHVPGYTGTVHIHEASHTHTYGRKKCYSYRKIEKIPYFTDSVH